VEICFVDIVIKIVCLFVVKTCFVRSQDNDIAPSSIQYPFYSENFSLSLEGAIRYVVIGQPLIIRENTGSQWHS